MNERIKELKEQALRWSGENVNRNLYSNYEIEQKEYEKFAQLIIFDILNEITNDDALGPSRVNILRRLSERYGVQRKME